MNLSLWIDASNDASPNPRVAFPKLCLWVECTVHNATNVSSVGKCGFSSHWVFIILIFFLFLFLLRKFAVVLRFTRANLFDHDSSDEQRSTTPYYCLVI
jgi:hypothetical protein